MSKAPPAFITRYIDDSSYRSIFSHIGGMHLKVVHFYTPKPKVFRGIKDNSDTFLIVAFSSTLGNASEQSSGNFRFHLSNQPSQLFLTFGFSSGVDVPGYPFSVDLWGVAPLP